MSRAKRPSQDSAGSRPVRIGRRQHEVIGRLTVRRHPYLLLKELGSLGRTRYMAFDPDARGELRLILVLPHSAAAEEHVRVLKRLPAGNVNLPRLLNYEVQQGELRLVLTWVEGTPLQSFLDAVRGRRARRVSSYESVRLVRGLAHGLRTLHQHAHLVHGDLTPANLILTSPTRHLAMIDFGSAWLGERTAFRAAGDGLTRVYAAPELQNESGDGLNFRADQFAASVIFYQLLTTQIPYANLGGKAGGPEYAARMADKLTAPSNYLPDGRHLPRSIRQAIDRVVKRGLAFDPDERYPTPGAWLEAIDSLFLEMQYLGRKRQGAGGAALRVFDWLAARFLPRSERHPADTN